MNSGGMSIQTKRYIKIPITWCTTLMGASIIKGSRCMSLGSSGRYRICTLGRRSSEGIGFEPIKNSQGLPKRFDISFTSISNDIRHKSNFSKALSVIHHPRTTSNVTQYQNSHRTQRVFISRLESLPSCI